MTLKDANKELEQLENDYNYWLNEKENALSIVSVQAVDIKPEKVDGGTRVDKMLSYAIKLDEKKIDETLEYIHRRKENLIRWMEEELRILKKYGEVESVIIQLKENKMVVDKISGKNRNMTWDEIASEVHYSKSFCRNIYRNYKKIRSID
jgi:hypothetical protein